MFRDFDGMSIIIIVLLVVVLAVGVSTLTNSRFEKCMTACKVDGKNSAFDCEFVICRERVTSTQTVVVPVIGR